MAMKDTRRTDAGRLIIANATLPLLTHLAVGTGAWPADPTARATAIRNATRLVQEIGRTRWLERYFVREQPGGPLNVGGIAYVRVESPTNLLFYRFRFLDAEAQGNWTEYGLFGDGVAYVQAGAVILDRPQSGDDRANRDVIVGGNYNETANDTITITVSTGGGNGHAGLNFFSALHGNVLLLLNVAFGAPIALTNGLTVTFTGGADGVLTHGDQWMIRATANPATPTFAAGGVYDPVGNLNGQVLVPGTLFTVALNAVGDPPDVKGAVTIDLPWIQEVINGGS